MNSIWTDPTREMTLGGYEHETLRGAQSQGPKHTVDFDSVVVLVVLNLKIGKDVFTKIN
jgi:hypothetical protein